MLVTLQNVTNISIETLSTICTASGIKLHTKTCRRYEIGEFCALAAEFAGLNQRHPRATRANQRRRSRPIIEDSASPYEPERRAAHLGRRQQGRRSERLMVEEPRHTSTRTHGFGQTNGRYSRLVSTGHRQRKVTGWREALQSCLLPKRRRAGRAFREYRQVRWIPWRELLRSWGV